MIRGTSVPISLRIIGDTLENAQHLTISIKQGDIRIDREAVPHVDRSDAVVSFEISVEESLKFKNGNADVQATWINQYGYQQKTLVEEIDILRTIFEEEL